MEHLTSNDFIIPVYCEALDICNVTLDITQSGGYPHIQLSEVNSDIQQSEVNSDIQLPVVNPDIQQSGVNPHIQLSELI